MATQIRPKTAAAIANLRAAPHKGSSSRLLSRTPTKFVPPISTAPANAARAVRSGAGAARSGLVPMASPLGRLTADGPTSDGPTSDGPTSDGWANLFTSADNR